MNGILLREWRKTCGCSNKAQATEDWFWRTLVADQDCPGLACPAWHKLTTELVLQDSDEIDLDTRRLMFESSLRVIFDFFEEGPVCNLGEETCYSRSRICDTGSEIVPGR